MLTNRLTERYRIKHPFTQAGMAFAGEKPELAIAVGRGGGIGAIGVGFLPPAELREHIAKLRDVGQPYNINFITCFGNEEQVKATAEEKVPVASFHWGLPPDDQVKMLKDSGADIWVQVGSVDDGEKPSSWAPT